MVTKTRTTADALGAKSCPGDHDHKPLEGIEVTLCAGYTAPFRRAVVNLVLAPEGGTYGEALALFDKAQLEKDDTSAGKSVPELVAPIVTKFEKKFISTQL